MGFHKQAVARRPFSQLAPFAALILSVTFVILFVIRYYVLESFLLRRIYGTKYTNLSDVNRRGFVNHHIAGITKFLILAIAIYPFIAVAFTTATLHTALAKGSVVTMGDILLVVSQMLLGTYIFELIYRPTISPVSASHHVGAIMVGQSAIAMSINYRHQTNADIEFILCCVWGAFDIVFELLPHIAIILYRLRPTRHSFLRTLFLVAAITTFVGTILETITVFTLWGMLWNKWQTPFKVLTPPLHLLFAAAQLHGSRIFYILHLQQTKMLKEVIVDVENNKAVDPGIKEKKVSEPEDPSPLAMLGESDVARIP